MILALVWASALPVDAAIPKKVKNDSALLQEISEIQVKKTRPTFRKDVVRLANLEERYVQQELAAHPRLKKVIQRLSSKKVSYRYSGKKKKKK